MTEEFKKARFSALPYLGSECYNPADVWCEGADWAYEWCDKNKMHWTRENSYMRKIASLEETLAIAVEALERIYGDKTDPPCDRDDCCLERKAAHEALAKIKGESE